MTTHKNLLLNVILLVAEVALITLLNYRIAGSFYSLDVLYCLPVIQAARLGAIRALRRSDTQTPLFVGVLLASIWSVGEVAVAWPTFPLSAFLINVVTRSVTLTIIGRVVTKLWKEREYSRKDSLTELANRLEFVEKFEVEQVRSARSGKPYSLLFIDIDQFKSLNDNHGHHVGDDALKVVSELLRKNSRMVDTVARIGGDEFVVLFPETDAQACMVLVHRITQTSEEAFNKLGWAISLSIGHVTETGKNRTADEVLRAADEKMYLNKKSKQ
jgi:diguanylate cyclase (GGDEF)-like protein